MNRIPFLMPVFALSVTCAFGAVIACGSLSDPSKDNGAAVVAQVSGALTGTNIPDGAHVALVWRTGTKGLAVGADVAVTGGRFTIPLNGLPPAGDFLNVNADNYESEDDELAGVDDATPDVEVEVDGGDGPPPSEVTVDAGTEGSTPIDAGEGLIGTRDVTGTVGASSGTPLQAAVAGFVVYLDANGNGQLDLDPTTGKTTDTVLGGANDYVLTYFQGGSSIDFEKLRDKTGVLPKDGYNVQWSSQGRWFGLDQVQLTLDSTTSMPGKVCAELEYEGPFFGDALSFPPKNAPGLTCTDSGQTFHIDAGWSCAGVADAFYLVCHAADDYPGCGGTTDGYLDGYSPVPSNWPCTVTGSPTGVVDGGVGVTGTLDAGVVDAGP